MTRRAIAILSIVTIAIGGSMLAQDKPQDNPAATKDPAAEHCGM